MWEASVAFVDEVLIDGFGSTLSRKGSWKDLKFEKVVPGFEW